MAVAAAYPQTDFKWVGQRRKLEWEPTGLESIKGLIPHDKCGIVFECIAGLLQINPAVVMNMAAFVNITLSKVAPAHI